MNEYQQINQKKIWKCKYNYYLISFHLMFCEVQKFHLNNEKKTNRKIIICMNENRMNEWMNVRMIRRENEWSIKLN